MTRRPMKPYIVGHEDEEDCEGYYDPDEAERRGCHHFNLSQLNPKDPCRICHNAWKVEDDARRQAEWDAKSPEEKAWHKAFIEELRKL